MPSIGHDAPRSEAVIFLASLAFQVESSGSLSPAEIEALQSLADSAPPTKPSGGRPFRILLEPGEPVREAVPAAARISWSEGLCLLEHAAFRAEIDPFRTEARVFRGDTTALGLITTLRTALACLLPLEGGLVLHAAGLEHARAGIAFFGPSGAGKSTLAARSPWAVLSDELVAVIADEPVAFRIRGTPFRKAPAGSQPSAIEQPPLRALVELGKGPAFNLTRLERTEALRRLIGSAAVPAAPPVWSAALRTMGDLVRDVPCYRMECSLEESPFEPLATALGLEPL